MNQEEQVVQEEGVSTPSPVSQPISYARKNRAERLKQAAIEPDFVKQKVYSTDEILKDYVTNLDQSEIDEIVRSSGIKGSLGEQAAVAVQNALMSYNSINEYNTLSGGNTTNYFTGNNIGDEWRDMGYEAMLNRKELMEINEESVGGVRSWLAKLAGGATSMGQMALEGFATGGILPMAKMALEAYGEGTFNDLKKYADEHEGSLEGYEPKGVDLAINTANGFVQAYIERKLGVASPRFLTGWSRGFWKEGVGGVAQEFLQSEAEELAEVAKGNMEVSELLDNVLDNLIDATVAFPLQGALGAVSNGQHRKRADAIMARARAISRGVKEPTKEDYDFAKKINDAKERELASALTTEFKAAFDESTGEGKLQKKIAGEIKRAVEAKELDLDTANETELAQRIEQIATQETLTAIEDALEKGESVSDLALNNIVYKDGSIWLEGLTPEVGDKAVGYARVLAERQSGLAEARNQLDAINAEIKQTKADLVQAQQEKQESRVKVLQARIAKQNALAEKNRIRAEKLEVQTAKLEKQIAKAIPDITKVTPDVAKETLDIAKTTAKTSDMVSNKIADMKDSALKELASLKIKKTPVAERKSLKQERVAKAKASKKPVKESPAQKKFAEQEKIVSEDVKLNQEASKGNKTAPTIALNNQKGHVEFNMVSLKDKTSIDYMRETALKNGMTEGQFNGLMDKVFFVADSINDALKDNPEWQQWNKKQMKTFLDKEGIPMPIRSIFVKNGDYDFNIDLGTLCVKREFADKVIKHLVDKGYGQQLGLVKLEQIKALLRKYEIAVACDVCFIEGKRLNARTLSNGMAYEWQSVRVALGITDDMQVGTDRTFTKEQEELLDKMTDRRFIKDDGSIMSEEEYDNLPKKEKSTFAESHKMVFQQAYEDYMPVERRRVKLGNIAYDRGITADKMYSIAKMFKQDATLAGELDPDILMNSEQTTALRERYYNTELPSFLGSYAGAGTPKPLYGFNPYTELSWRDNYDRNADKLNQMLFEIGGVRGQSFSDYNELLVVDYIQKYLAETIRGVPAHEYTKQSTLVKTFGDTGVMFNMSLVPKIEEGVDNKHYGLRKATEEEIKNGKSKEGYMLRSDDQGTWTYSFHEDSFPVDEAFDLRNKFDKTSGIIVVGVSDMQIEMMLDDPTIDMIIPFHASGMPAHTKLMTGLVDVDYTKTQTTKGKKASDPDFSYNANLQKIGDPRKTADAYKAWCKENGYTEKFPQFSKNKNYYKLLEDFRGYDKDGNPVLQQAVDISKADWNRIIQEGIAGVKERVETVKTGEETVLSEDFAKELEDIFKYQQVDTETQNLFKDRLSKTLGKNNVEFLRQNDFLAKLREIQGAEAFRNNTDGTVYGFAVGNKVYINESAFNAHTPAHEFTHIWAKVVQQVNPKLWAKGVDLLKKTQTWYDVQHDELYWQIQEDENAVAREVLSRLTGMESEAMIKQMLDYHTKGHASAKALVDKIMNFFKEMWGALKDAFNIKADLDITLEDFYRMPLRDLLDESRHKAFKDAMKKANLDGVAEFNQTSDKYLAQGSTTGKGDTKRGGYDEELKRIILKDGADLSTIQHEFAHYWMQNNFKWARSGLASQDWLRRWRDVEEWLGIEPQDRLLSKSASEKFAKAYERYILEGKVAPELQWAFEGFQKAYQDIYSDLEDDYFDLSEELAPEVVDWFNRNKEQSPKRLLEADTKKIEKQIALSAGASVIEDVDGNVVMTEQNKEGDPVVYMGVKESEIPAGDNLLVQADKTTASKLQQSAKRWLSDKVEVQQLTTLDTQATLENFKNWIARDRAGAWDAMMNPDTRPIYRTYLYKAFAQEAMNNADLAVELANIDMGQAVREMGQAIQALDIRNESGFDTLEIMRNIEKSKGKISTEELNKEVESIGLDMIELSQADIDEIEFETECKL